MPSLTLISLLSRKILHKKRKPRFYRLPSTFDLEFYEYNFATFILYCQLRFFRMGIFIVHAIHLRQILGQISIQ